MNLRSVAAIQDPLDGKTEHRRLRGPLSRRQIQTLFLCGCPDQPTVIGRFPRERAYLARVVDSFQALVFSARRRREGRPQSTFRVRRGLWISRSTLPFNRRLPAPLQQHAARAIRRGRAPASSGARPCALSLAGQRGVLICRASKSARLGSVPVDPCRRIIRFGRCAAQVVGAGASIFRNTREAPLNRWRISDRAKIAAARFSERFQIRACTCTRTVWIGV